MDDGLGGSFSQIDSAQVNNIPSLRSHSITFSSTKTSSTYRFYMVAQNVIGSITTDTISFVLAATPDMPTIAPYLNLAGTRSYQIEANYDSLPTTKNGGSEILSYELQIYNLTNS